MYYVNYWIFRKITNRLLRIRIIRLSPSLLYYKYDLYDYLTTNLF